ncbi:Protein of unknown function [Altererythrobacter xiamenensis]|uniref:DUF2924 domain-containing protein n=1 Tax=Altererythrobacter xiamenensis TaxID=1316679 RepID=A0A1Y6FAL1_9SPHN|nr:DUF2924 domain-containing protein [Altererythrobacter xiamenensis]SMQ69812.1 Protein of unknown function [Altererythrobacter xiamenensis]
MANNNSKRAHSDAGAPASEPDNYQSNSHPGSQITKLTDLDADLTALADMTLAQLRSRWLEVCDQPVPRVRQTLLRLALAYELQAALHGGLSRRTEQRLAYLAGKNSAPDTLRPGMRLVREWNGTLHTVHIDEDGLIHWQEKTWRSLSEVARAITGTRWSGPAFFGLRQRKAT